MSDRKCKGGASFAAILSMTSIKAVDNFYVFDREMGIYGLKTAEKVKNPDPEGPWFFL